MGGHNLKWKLMLLILLSIIIFPAAVKASTLSTPSSNINGPLKIMLPAPQILEKAKAQNESDKIREIYDKVAEKNKNDNVKPLPPGGAGMRKSVQVPKQAVTPVQPAAKALAIAVQYTDESAATDISYFQNLLFKDVFGTMRDYYRTVSGGKFILEGKVVGADQDTVFITLPHNKNYYAQNSYGFDGAYPHNTQGLVADAVQALIDANFDWTPYKADGTVPYLFVIHAGAGAESSGDRTDMWSCRWSLNDNKIVDGDTTINDFTLEPELTADESQSYVKSTMGVYAHEFGHNLGLPDLYDINNITKGVGNWSLMGSGSWAGPDKMGEVPVELDGWSKAFLGWTTPEVVPNGTNEESIPRIEGSFGKILRLNTPQTNEYFLIENRQQTSYDQYMDGNGLLIWHIDSKIADPNSVYWNNYNTVNSTGADSPPHHGVYVVEADGKNELDSGGNRGDAGDPFPGSSNVRTVKGSGRQNPNLSTWDGQESKLSLADISNSGDVMSATVTVGDTQEAILKALTAEPASLNLTVGEESKITLKATYSDGGQKDISTNAEWKSSKDEIVTVEVDKDSGLVNILALAKGTATITASFGGKKLSIPVKVTPAVIGLQAPENATLLVGKLQAVKVRVEYEDGTTSDATKTIQWDSGDETVAKMTTAGIRGIGVGETTITGKYNADLSISIGVKVILPMKKLTADSTLLNLSVGGSDEISLTAVYTNNTNEDVTGAASWKSSNPKIAVVDNEGGVTAVAKGAATITAGFGGKRVSVRVRVA